MIEYVKLVNFQGHEHFEARFHPRLTVFSGQTDAGKSTILRALLWVATNEPGEYVRTGAKFCKAVVGVDGRKVVRVKGKGKNYYLLDGKKFNAVASKVPDEIAVLFNVSEDNYQDQHDAAFWFSLTPGQASKHLNAIVNLTVIDDAMAHVAAAARKAKQVAELTEERLHQAEAKRDGLVWVRDMDNDLHELTQTEQEVERARRQVERLQRLVDQARNQEEVIAKLGRVPPLGKLETTAAEIEAETKSLERLESLITQAKKCEDDRCAAIRSLEQINARLKTGLKKRCPACGRTG